MAALACALALTPVSGAGSSARPIDRAAIQELLDARAQAIRDGDLEAFLGTVAPGSPGFRTRQTRAFAGWQSLPLESYELDANWERAGDLARPRDARAYPSADNVSLPLTEERYALTGIDDKPAVEDLFLTFVEIDGNWLVASDDDLADVGMFSGYHLWDQGPVEISRDGRFALIEHPCSGDGARPFRCARLPEDFIDTARQALRGAEDRLPQTPLPDTIAILAPGNQQELARLIQATYSLDNFLAFAIATVETRRGIEYTGRRIALNWTQVGDSSTEDLRTIVMHELVHIATRGLAGSFTPIFAEEGIAEYVARMDDDESLAALDSAVAEGRFDHRLPRDHEFRTGGPESIFLGYKESQSAITFLIERWGERAFLDFYRSLGRSRVAAGTTEYHVDRALRRAIGLSLKRFERVWADSID